MIEGVNTVKALLPCTMPHLAVTVIFFALFLWIKIINYFLPVEVMESLLCSGANPLSQTDAGESVYECLLKWRLRTGGDLDSQTLKECLNMEKKLSEAMKKGG